MREETLRLSTVLVEIIEQKQGVSSEKTNENQQKLQTTFPHSCQQSLRQYSVLPEQKDIGR